MNEKYYDKLLNINTIGNQNWNKTSAHNHPYEPTLYSALETLFKEYTLSEDDYVVDFGCGLGRLNFYINYYFNCNVTGIEVNERYYQESLYNKSQYIKERPSRSDKINFICTLAQKYEIYKKDNKFYFFNPFSVEIFISVINNICDSYYENPRDIDLIMYYPSTSYLDYLDYLTPFSKSKEIRFEKLYEDDDREKFMIYTLKSY